MLFTHDLVIKSSEVKFQLEKIKFVICLRLKFENSKNIIKKDF